MSKTFVVLLGVSLGASLLLGIYSLHNHNLDVDAGDDFRNGMENLAFLCDRTDPIAYSSLASAVFTHAKVLSKTNVQWYHIGQVLPSESLETIGDLAEVEFEGENELRALAELDLRPLLELDDDSDDYRQLEEELNRHLDAALESVPLLISCELLLSGFKKGEIPTAETLLALTLHKSTEELVSNRILMLHVIALAEDAGDAYDPYILAECIEYALSDPEVAVLLKLRPEILDGMPPAVLDQLVEALQS